MTHEERFERIEADLAAMVSSQVTWQGSLVNWQADIKTAMAGLIEAQVATQRSITTLNESIARYVDSADARMKQIEASLDALLRAITAEHSNGKGKPNR
jgi:hypothetical protein